MAVKILGNYLQQTILLHGINNNLLPHSLLFSGPQGIGKKLFALLLAKTKFCSHGTACDSCSSCIQIIHNIHPDVIVIHPNEKGSIPIGEPHQEGTIRWLIDRISLASVNPWRFVIINDAHCMNVQAQNALLKSIEEPPVNTYIILITHRRNQLLPTIRSRTAEYVFHHLSDDDIIAILKAHDIEQQKIQSILPIANGSASYALLLANDEAFAKLTFAYTAISQFVCNPVIFSYELSPLDNADIYTTIDLLINMFRLHLKGDPHLPWQNIDIDKKRAIDIIKILLELQKSLSHNINIRMALKGMLYSLCFQ